ncbi:hypothetical protein KI387_032740, partial [Taxus chinensis]
MEDDKSVTTNTEEGEAQNAKENGQVSQPEGSLSSELDLPSEQSSRRPFTSLSQEDSDLALARALQEQERAYMMLRMNAESSDHETSGSGSYDHEDYIDDSGENEEDINVIADEIEANALVDDPNEELDPSLFDSDEAYARALQEAEDRDMTARMMALAGINGWEEEDIEENDGSSQDDTWQDVDPDNMLYEELVALGEVVGTQSRGLEPDAISSLPQSKYAQQNPSSSNCEQCVICHVEYEEEDMILTLPCKHQYHSGCINDWLKINK